MKPETAMLELSRKEACLEIPHPSPTTHSTVLIIGGSGVIGRAIAQPFAQAGWNLGLHYRTSLQEAQTILGDLHFSGGIGNLYRADICDEKQTVDMFHRFLADWKRLDVVIVATGIASHQLIVRTSPEQWQEILKTNLTGVFHCLKTAGGILADQQSGSVLIVGSLSGSTGTTGQAAYAASKAGLTGLVKTAAREWGPANVRVNLLFPGWHPSPLSGTAFPQAHDLGDHVLGRTPNVSTIGEMAYHIANLPDTSGQIFNLDSRIL